MPKTRSVIRPKIKEQILLRLKNEGVPVAKLAEEHGISSKAIYNWLAKEATGHPSLLEFSKLKKRNQALSELLGQVMMELELLKKKRAH